MGGQGQGPDQTVLVLGGGIGGVAAANRLRRRLDQRHRFVLVNQDPDFTFAASYLRVMSGDRRSEQVTGPLHLLRRRGIEVVIGDIEAIDPGTKRFAGHSCCFIETGYGKAAYGSGDFYAQPDPAVKVRPPSRHRHLGKVLFEYNVLRRWL